MCSAVSDAKTAKTAGNGQEGQSIAVLWDGKDESLQGAKGVL